MVAHAMGGVNRGAGPGETPKNRFKLFHFALFCMWRVGHRGAVLGAFGARMDARRGRLATNGTPVLGEGAYGRKVGRADVVVHGEMIARAFVEGNV